MSMDKAIKSGKEKRKKYRGAKAISPSCRNHGSCNYCRENRLYQQRKLDEKSESLLKEYHEAFKGLVK